MGRKYVHGFLTDRLMALGINHDQSLVIRHIMDFISSGKMTTVVHDGEVYYWIKYDKIVSDLEFLGIKKQALSDMLIYDLSVKPSDWNERLANMTENTRKRKQKSKFIGLFKRFTKKDAEGTYSYFAPTELLYTLQEDITDNDNDIKKASNGGTKEADKEKQIVNKSICTSKENNTTKEGKNIQAIKESLKNDNEVIEIIKESCVNVKAADLNKCVEEFTDIDKLKIALSKCEDSNSHGIKAIRKAYKSVGRVSNTKGCNNNFEQYGGDLESKLHRAQEGKFDRSYAKKEKPNTQKVEMVNNFTDEKKAEFEAKKKEEIRMFKPNAKGWR